jgi:chromosome segregation ATPase
MNESDTPRTDEWYVTDERYGTVEVYDTIRKQIIAGVYGGKTIGEQYEIAQLIADAPKLKAELTAARAEIEAIMETLQSPIEVELDMIRGKIAIPDRAELDYIAQIKTVTEQRDELSRQLNVVTIQRNKLAASLDVAQQVGIQLGEQRDRLAEEIRLTIMENLHLADGDKCTLKRLKDAIGFESEEKHSNP